MLKFKVPIIVLVVSLLATLVINESDNKKDRLSKIKLPGKKISFENIGNTIIKSTK